MRLPISVSAALLLLAPLVPVPVLGLRHKSGMQVGPIEMSLQDVDLLGTNGTNGWGTFDQLLDHSDPSKGTFKQRFWYGTKFWKGPGSPIILTTPGEQKADGFNKTYTTEKRLTGLMAKKMGGANIILEHRYWGESSPFQSLTAENLQYLTLDNSLKDLTYFAKNFVPPFDKSGKSHPATAPWVYAGGSYSGALAGWLERLEPGTFWAYYGSSAVVEAITDFYTYYSGAMEAAPKNCTKDLVAVIDYVDNILFHGSAEEKQQLKDKFKVGDLGDKDFANILTTGPGTWQGNQFFTLAQDGVVELFEFCDYVENAWPGAPSISNENGVGLEKALAGFVKWWLEIAFPGSCESYGLEGAFNGTYNTDCFKWENPNNPLYKDLRVDNVVIRAWMWMLCNEPFEWWQTGAPFGTPSIVSRKVDVDYYRQQCAYMFPEGGYGMLKGKTVEMVNNRTDGWFHTNTKRLMYANGQYDPWVDATVSSPVSRPGGPLQSTKDLPVWVVPGGNHCSDLYGQNWDVNPEVKAIADAEVEQMAGWVAEFYTQKSKREVPWVA